MSDKTYNGWRNYETWNVKLWIDNDEGGYRYWEGVADQCLENNILEEKDDGNEYDTDAAKSQLAEQLKQEVNENAPDLGSSCYADLLNAALGEVDWYEIAEHMIDDAIERVTA